MQKHRFIINNSNVKNIIKNYIKQLILHNKLLHTGCPNKIVACLCGCCGGAVDSIVSVFTQLLRSDFNLDFEFFFESI